MQRYILTIGPSLLYNTKITKIHNTKYIYRINGAHGTVGDIEGHIQEIRRQVSDADILLDLPGNKVRTSGTNIKIEKGKVFTIPSADFNYKEFYALLKPGMIVWANDSVYEFEVISADEKQIEFLSKSDGILSDNKGMHIRGINERLPFLFDKDVQLIKLANQYKLAFVGLSFVRSRDDIEEAKKLIHSSIIISKVETLTAVKNLNEILDSIEFIIVDRGDLSTEIGIENVPHYQQYIIEKAHYFDRKVFLATQILKNMETKPIPTIAEINDLYSVSKQGVYGIQLSEETAVGEYVENTVAILKKMNENLIRESIVLSVID